MALTAEQRASMERQHGPSWGSIFLPHLQRSALAYGEPEIETPEEPCFFSSPNANDLAASLMTLSVFTRQPDGTVTRGPL